MWMKCLRFLILCSALSASAQTVPAAGPIVIWKVGSPYTGDTPDTTVPLDLKLRGEKLGREIQIQAFPAVGFAQIFFDAFEKNQEPDIVAFDNIGILEGITTERGAFTGIGQSATIRKSLVRVTGTLEDLAGQLGGWQFLVSTSKNHEAAKVFALPPPQCDASLSPTSVPAEVQSISQRMSGAFLEQAAALKTYADHNRLVAEGGRRGPVQVSETAACGFWGSDNLAFVSVVSSYESSRAVGQTPLLLVLRKHDAQWRLLVASTDPDSNKRFVTQLPMLSGLLQTPTNPRNAPQPAGLLSPLDGQSPVPGPGQRYGSFTWSPSSSKNVVAEIAEFAYEGDARLFLRLVPKQRITERISAGELLTSRTEWIWRVWSITDAGRVAFSQSRSFLH